VLAGGGLDECYTVIRNNTITSNTAPLGGGIWADTGHNDYGDLSILNCIFRENVASTAGGGDHLKDCPTPTYSCIEEWTGGGTGNITSDPLFADSQEGDFSLLLASPCIDAGGTAAGLSEDYDEESRPQDWGALGAAGDGSNIDIGADEVPAPLAPFGLSARAVAGSIQIDWSALPASWVSSYEVYRETSPTGDFNTAAVTGLTDNTWTDTSVTAGTTYYYRVKVVYDQSAGTSDLSDMTNATALGTCDQTTPANWM
jgi:hypothetical protein